MNNIIMELKNIQKTYKGAVDNLHILRDLNLQIESGDFMAILGRSGSGKSTLLHIMGLLDKPDSGTILLNNVDINTYRKKDIDTIKNRVFGFVFQFHYLLPEFTALENVLMPTLISHNTSKKINLENAKKLLEAVGLKDRMQHKPNQLSGGEKQRVAIARALVNNPKILFADEPTGNLDEETSEKIFGLFRDINTKLGQTIVVVTHSKDLAQMTKKNLYIKRGTIG